jgi:hypothetical protein
MSTRCIARLPFRATSFTSLLAGALIALGPADALRAQQPDPNSPGWMLHWSPLQRAGVLPRSAPLLHGASATLLGPAPRTGTFWSGGNPAGLAWETGASHAELGGRAAAAEGDFRRPLEPGAVTSQSATALAWQPVGEAAGLIGHATYEEIGYDPGTWTSALSPWGSSPYVLTDSTRSAHRIGRIRVEGAGGRRFGSLAIGAAIAHEALDGHSRLTRVPRLNRSSRPAGVAGLAWNAGPAWVGIYGRAAHDAETAQIFGAGSPTIVQRLNGTAPPTTIIVGQNLAFYHRREALSRGGGVTLSGVAAGWSWAAHGDAGSVRERLWMVRSADPPTDRWDADVFGSGLSLQRSVRQEAASITLHGRWARSAGSAWLSRSDTLIYRGVESAAWGGAALRWQPATSAWAAAAALNVGYDRRDRGDTAEVSLRTRLEGLTTQFATEVAHELDFGVTLSAGYTLTGHSARGSAPAPIHYPAATRRILAGENAFMATPSLGHGASLGAALHVGPATAFRLQTRYHSLAPSGSGPRFELAPAGSRTQWSVELGAVLGARLRGFGLAGGG